MSAYIRLVNQAKLFEARCAGLTPAECREHAMLTGGMALNGVRGVCAGSRDGAPVWEDCVNAVADVCEASNKAFDRERFIAACGGIE